MAAVAVAFVVVVSGFATLALSGGSGSVARGATPSASTASASAPRSGSGAPAPTAAAERVSALNEALRDRGVPLQDIHPPNLGAERPGARGPVSPTYATGPAPMGLADLGLRNVSGSLEPYALATSSVWGSVNLTRAASVYVDGDGPDTFGIQLNAVASNVTLFGGTGYEFWTQDFVSYTSSTQQLSFGDNVWNFSADAISANVFAATSPNGTLVAPYFYYAVGPTFTVAYPFTLGLYLNSTVVGHEPAVFFNYTVAESNGTTLKGSFDDVVFASSAHPSAHPAPPPAFAINGSAVDPIGLPNDFELDLVGNDDGDTTTFFAMNATLGLAYWNASLGAYATVPSAYDAGSDTGETSTGILPTYTVPVLGGPPTVHVGLGPSYVQGLWNVSAALNGSRSFLLVQRPQNAFLFVSPGTSFDPASAQWVPTLRLGASTTSFVLPNEGNFSLEWMLSDREPETFAVSNLVPLPNSTTGIVLNLTVNATYGSYTPLLAYGNAELKAISQHGAGTLANPYILVHHPLHSLDPVFGQMNDFGFPVFAGVLLVNTTSYVRLLEPAVTIDYGSWQYGQLDGLGLPHVNELQLEFWNVSDVAVLNSSGISGWLSVELSAFPEGELLFWGSSDDLVANDTFYDQGTAIALYGGTGTTIWGNRVLTG
ncbi:MAG TPA: thermopsin family protease, partial [Thermoplasmata archaeon]|nr:thermopsin family protease [Thermoplasmata archaeon]